MAATMAMLCTLPNAAAFHAAAGLRPTTRSASVNMLGLPSIAAPTLAAPSLSLPSLALPDVGAMIGSVPTELLIGVPVVGALGVGAFVLFAPEPDFESQMGPAFTSSTITPAMKDALASKKEKASLKYKFVDPVVKTIDDSIEGVKDRIESAKKEAEQEKKEKEEAAARIKGINDGTLIPLSLPLGITGVVVPNVVAQAKAKANDLLPAKKSAKKEGLKLPEVSLPF